MRRARLFRVVDDRRLSSSSLFFICNGSSSPSNVSPSFALGRCDSAVVRRRRRRCRRLSSSPCVVAPLRTSLQSVRAPQATGGTHYVGPYQFVVVCRRRHCCPSPFLVVCHSPPLHTFEIFVIYRCRPALASICLALVVLIVFVVGRRRRLRSAQTTTTATDRCWWRPGGMNADLEGPELAFFRDPSRTGGGTPCSLSTKMYLI